MEKKQLYEFAERIRRELHALVDQHMDDFVKRIEAGNLSSRTAMTCSLRDRIIISKGRNPCQLYCPAAKNDLAQHGGKSFP